MVNLNDYLAKLSDYLNPRNLIALGAITTTGFLLACGRNPSIYDNLQHIFNTQNSSYTEDISTQSIFSSIDIYKVDINGVEYILTHLSGNGQLKRINSINPLELCQLVIGSDRGYLNPDGEFFLDGEFYMDNECDGTPEGANLAPDKPVREIIEFAEEEQIMISNRYKSKLEDLISNIMPKKTKLEKQK